MADDHETPHASPDETDPAPSDLLIEEDMPCIKCGYNLRGLHDDGQCPECGATIEETLDFVLATVLCPSCLAPNHPSVSVCAQCGQPVSGAAATADYYRTKPVYGGKPRPPLDDDEPDAPSVMRMILCWAIGLFLLMNLAMAFSSLWSDRPGELGPSLSIPAQTAWSAIVVLLSAIPIGIIYFPTRNYRRQRRQYDHDCTAFALKTAAANAADAASRKIEP